MDAKRETWPKPGERRRPPKTTRNDFQLTVLPACILKDPRLLSVLAGIFHARAGGDQP